MKNTNNKQFQVRKGTHRCDGSVLVVTLGIIAILFAMVAVTLHSTANKYFTAYQWASWQEALQGAESGADLAMGELRKDADNTSATIPWAGWNLGNYVSVNGNKTLQKDVSSYKALAADGTYLDNSGGGNGNQKAFSVTCWTSSSITCGSGYDFITYSTKLAPHAGEGNQNLGITITIDKPATLVDPSSG